MKVYKEGALIFVNGHLTVTGWGFVDPLHKPSTREADERKMTKACLLYLANKYDIQLVDPENVERFSIDSERAALDAIAVARWGGDPLQFNKDQP